MICLHLIVLLLVVSHYFVRKAKASAYILILQYIVEVSSSLSVERDKIYGQRFTS